MRSLRCLALVAALVLAPGARAQLVPMPPPAPQPGAQAAPTSAQPAPPAQEKTSSLERAAEERRAAMAARQRAASEWIRARIPPSLSGSTFLGLEAWQWVFVWSAFAAGLLLATLVRLVVARWIRGSFHAGGPAPDKDSLRRATKPFGLGAASILWHQALPLAGLDPMVLHVLQSATRLFGVTMAAWAAFRMADYLAIGAARRAARTESKLDDLLVPLVRTSIKGGACIVAIIAALGVLGVSVGPLLASVGLGGLAVAFAAKDTIENFFGSIAVIADRPFEVGDTIVTAGITGEVLEVGFRSTRLRTASGSIVTLPNATLVRATVERLGTIRARPTGITLRLAHASAPDAIAAACEEMRAMLKSNARVLPDNQQVRLIGSNEWGLELLVQANLDVEGRPQELEVREEVLMASLAILRSHGLELAGPRASC